MAATLESTSTTCADCGVSWPAEPERPSLVGGCRGCRREYSRRYQRTVYNPQNRRVQSERSLARYRRVRGTEKDYHLRDALKQRGLSYEDYQRMLTEQDGKCAICGGVESGRFSRLAIDHDHATGEVRGLLCGRCNKAIGLLRDDPAIVRGVLKYLTIERV